MHSQLTALHSDFCSYYTGETALFKNTENIITKPEVTFLSLLQLTFLQHLTVLLLKFSIFLSFLNINLFKLEDNYNIVVVFAIPQSSFINSGFFIFCGLIFNLNTDGMKGFTLKPILSSLDILMTNHSSVLLQTALFHSFLWLSNSPLYAYHIFFIHSSTDGHLCCFHVLYCNQCCDKHRGACILSDQFSLDRCPGVGVLDHIAILFLDF